MKELQVVKSIVFSNSELEGTYWEDGLRRSCRLLDKAIGPTELSVKEVKNRFPNASISFNHEGEGILLDLEVLKTDVVREDQDVSGDGASKGSVDSFPSLSDWEGYEIDYEV